MARRKGRSTNRRQRPQKVSADTTLAEVVEMLGLEAIVLPTEGPEAGTTQRALLRKKIARNPGVVVGDLVRLGPVEQKEDDDGPAAVIESVEPRRNVLVRAGYAGRRQPIAANLDHVVVVASPIDPPLRLGLIDRYLAAAYTCGIEPVICINKADLDPEGYARELLEPYEDIPVPVVFTSAETDPPQIEELRQLIGEKRSVLVGHSGVGKSSLACALIPGLDRDIGEVSEYHGKGRHTTTTASLLELPEGGRLVDTPGVRAFGLFGIEPGELRLYYPEFLELAEGCRFRTCTHVHEPGCAVMAAVEDDEIDYGRYERYIEIVLSLEHPNT